MQTIEAVARAICCACGEKPAHRADARGNDWRWQDYTSTAQAVMGELQAAGADPGRSAIPHLAQVICTACKDEPAKSFLYTQAAGEAARVYYAHRSATSSKAALRQPCPVCGGQPQIAKGKPYASYWRAFCPTPHGVPGRCIAATPMKTRAQAEQTWDTQAANKTLI
jgi:hypothetical protein